MVVPKERPVMAVSVQGTELIGVVRTIEQVKASPLDARRFVFFVRKREYWYDYRLNEVSVEQHTVHEFYTKMQ